jgi:myosin heavy subunit
MQFDHPSFQRVMTSPRSSAVPPPPSNGDCLAQKSHKRWVKTTRGAWKDVIVPPGKGQKANLDVLRESIKSSMIFDSDKKSEAAKGKVSKTPKMKKGRKGVKSHENWDFGKPKAIAPIARNRKNEKAAIVIQKMMRGWWQRLRFKIVLLQHKLNTRKERTDACLDRVKDRFAKQKEIVRTKLENAHRRELEKVTKEEVTASEGQQLIAFLRKENKKLREKNTKIHAAICALKVSNERLSEANNKSDKTYSTLADHAKEIKDTHKKLTKVVPKYKESVDILKEAVELRRQYCLSEHKIKLLYTKCMGTVVEIVESACNDKALANEVVGLCLKLEDEDHPTDPPPKSIKDDYDDITVCSSSDDEYDEYTVASMD